MKLLVVITICVIVCLSSSFQCRGIQKRSLLSMGGFGENKDNASKSIGSGMAAIRRQEKIFFELEEKKSTTGIVHVKAKDSETWNKVGKVIAEDGNLAAAAQGQKRLILDHAVLLYTFLMAEKASLEIGYSIEDGEISSVSKDAYNGEKVGLQLDTIKSGPFYKQSDQYGLAGRVDVRSSAGKSSQIRGSMGSMKSASKTSSDSK